MSKLNRHNSTWTQEQRQTVALMFVAGFPTTKIALAVGRSYHSTAGEIFRLRHGPIQVGTTRLPDPRPERISERFAPTNYVPTPLVLASRAPTQARTCLSCRATFPSRGAGNRICLACKVGDRWREGSCVLSGREVTL